jgi:alkanesulfonate monooxygenase SsuD/methylene tetrahydromethanopterin reductase-like flavin-dependent oxidoreductase (luciferase family)
VINALPIGVCIRSIGAEPRWWLESARRLDAAGYRAVWAWDHFMGLGSVTVPVVEGWTALSMAAGATNRVAIGSFVLNVMNRHPAVLARMASTLQIASGGRLLLGVGIGGHPQEHAAYGIDFPETPERAARLEEAVATLRALWRGGPVTRDSPFFPLHRATAYPIPDPPPPIVIGAGTRRGAELAARIGDGWAANDANMERFMPDYLEALDAAGKRRDDQTVYMGFEGGDWLGDGNLAETAWCREPKAAWEGFRAVGADAAIVLARTTRDIDALIDATGRW